MHSDPFQEALATGQRTFAGVTLTVDRFRQLCDAMGVAPEDLGPRSAELCLAAACADGDRAALGHFERNFLTGVGRHVGRFGLTDAQVEEIRQEVRIRLLCGPRPRIATYSGRAPLDAWVRVTAIRAALDLVDGENRAGRLRSDFALERVVAGCAPAESFVGKQGVRQAFQEALDQALSALSKDERTILRLHFVDNLTIDGIGRVFRVHRATAARWLVAIRASILEQIRRRLSIDLQPSPSEFRSLVRMVESELHLSLDRQLA